MKIAILIITGKKFAYLWPNLLALYQKNWPDHPSIFIATDERLDNIGGDNVFFLEYPNLIYSDMLTKALGEIDADYVLLTLADDYVYRPVDNDHFLSLLNAMERKNIDYCLVEMAPRKGAWLDKSMRLKKIGLKLKCYEISLKPSIWRKSSLLKIIKPSEEAWKFEVRLNRRSRENNFLCARLEDRKKCFYVNAVSHGKYNWIAAKKIKSNGLDFSDLPVFPFSQYLKIRIWRLVVRCTPTRFSEWLRSLKKNRYSDFADSDDLPS